ncbi:MAG: hypothetical protein LDLANPLL_00635 [Turneriella sp.]|nr:hypothetical protein [Turneriella sp.]
MLQPRAWLCYLLATANFTCGQLSREDLLNGNFGDVDRNPPRLIIPNDYKVTTRSTTLSWTLPRGSSSYTVDIATDSSFTQPIPGSPFTTTESNLALTFADALTYYWRVRANTTEKGVFSAAQRIHILDGAVRVYCPSAEVSCTNTNRFGTKNSPYQVIQTALAEAKAANVEVWVASRGSTGYYAESLNLIAGVSIRGGYSGLDWSRDIEANTTEIQFNSTRLISATYLSPPTLVVEGFTFTNTNSGINYVLYIEGTSYLSIENNRIKPGKGAGGGTFAYGIYCDNASPKITNNAILAGSALSGNSAIKLMAGSSPLITGNRLVGGSASGIGIEAALSGAVIFENTIFAGNSTAAKGIDDSPSGPKTLVGYNFIHGGYGSSTSTALYTASGQQRIFYNNIDTGNAATANGIAVSPNAASNPIIDMNLFYNQGGGSTIYAINETSGTQSPLYVRRNTFITANGLLAYYENNATSYATICSVDGKPAATTTACTGVDVNAGGGATVGNQASATLATNLKTLPISILFTTDGVDANTTYDGSINRIEVTTEAACNLFNVNDYFDLFSELSTRQVASRNCSPTASFVDFSPNLSRDFGRSVPIVLWGSTQPVAKEKYALKLSATALNGGALCPANFESAVHKWGSAMSQAECDSKYPHANSHYNTGFCETVYLYPAVEIASTKFSSGPFGVPISGNGLCEAGETCFYNPNSGGYAGHGNLISAGCDLSAVAGGAFSTVTLLKYDSNGY